MATPAAPIQDLVITRLFKAPRALVFRAWSDPQHLMRWFCPDGFTTPLCTVDFRVGGIFHYYMRAPDGKDYHGRGVYQELVVPERIAYLDTFTDANGQVVPPSFYGIPGNEVVESLVTVTFEAQGDQTLLTIRHALRGSAEETAGAREGWTQMLGHLAKALAEG
jgi:uncharacterized protein YndB with AHSA1/START domain